MMQAIVMFNVCLAQEVRKAKWQDRIEVAVKTMQQGAMSEEDFIDEAQTMK